MIQNDRTGLDQKWSASMRRARPPQADVVAPLGHLARHLAVVRLPGVVKPVGPGERDVEQEADQDDEQARLTFTPVVGTKKQAPGARRQAHESADAKRAVARCRVGRSKGPDPPRRVGDANRGPPPTQSCNPAPQQDPSRQIRRLALHSAHVRHRRVRGTKAGDSDPAGRAAAARVPRLRLGRRGDRRTRGAPRCCAAAASWPGLEALVDARAARGDARHRAHALGDPRPPLARNAHPHKVGRRLRRSQRHHRELPGAAGAPGGGRAQVLVRDRHRDRRPPDRRGAAGGRADAGRSDCAGRCVRCTAPTRSWSSPTSTRASWSPPRTPRRWCSGSARARPSWPPTCRRILEHTREVIFLEEGDVVAVTARQGGDHRRRRQAARSRSRAPSPGTPPRPRRAATRTSCSRRSTSSRAPSPTRCAAACCSRPRDADLDGFELDPRGAAARAAARLRHLVPRRAGRQVPHRRDLARIPCEVDLASEFRYRDPVVGPEDLVIAISQSGETADTLAAVKEARARGARVLAISNVVDSAIPRASNGVALHPRRARDRRRLDQVLHRAAGGAGAARHPPRAAQRQRCSADAAAQLVERAGAHADQDDARRWRGWAISSSSPGEYRYARDFLFLGRGTNYPIALEGALKLKEISYIHAEGYAAGEMKHGPIALIDDGVPGGGAGAARARLRQGAVEPGRGARPQRAHHRASATEGGRAAGRAVRPTCCRSPTRRRCCSRSSRCCRCSS